MGFHDCIMEQKNILMEGALGERLKREYQLSFDADVAMARLIESAEGRNALKELWTEYIAIARKYSLPFLATTPTRRANRERMARGNCRISLIEDNVTFLQSIQQESNLEMYVGGLMGCKGDAYTGEDALTEVEAEHFHAWQADLFCKAGVDFLYAGIMPALPEAAGMARAMAATGLPYMISFTIQKDGKLVDGTTISDAIAYIDNSTQRAPVCYMTNCVHPRIVREALSQPYNENERVRSRFIGIQANTSPLTLAELDGSVELKCSPPEEFGEEMLKLRAQSNMKIFGGCCGTDGRHMEAVARRLFTEG